MRIQMQRTEAIARVTARLLAIKALKPSAFPLRMRKCVRVSLRTAFREVKGPEDPRAEPLLFILAFEKSLDPPLAVGLDSLDPAVTLDPRTLQWVWTPGPCSDSGPPDPAVTLDPPDPAVTLDSLDPAVTLDPPPRPSSHSAVENPR